MPVRDNRNRNYGKLLEGPWVFGMCWWHDGFFVVERRNRATLIPITEREILPGTTIMSDEGNHIKFYKIQIIIT
jgi:hypothetical protein